MSPLAVVPLHMCACGRQAIFACDRCAGCEHCGCHCAVPSASPTTTPPTNGKLEKVRHRWVVPTVTQVTDERFTEGGILLDRLAEFFRKYLVLPSGGAETLALYAAYTYEFSAFDVAPLLAIPSPVKQCGKTRTLDLLSSVVREPQTAGNASVAALFRLIEQQAVTLLLDEYDTYFLHNEELRGIINSGHTRRFAYVLRAERKGDDFTPKRFSTWCPKILAGLNRLPPTIEDRSIVVPMRRKEAHERVAKLQLGARLDAETMPLRADLERWTTAHKESFRTAQPDPISNFADRANDNWAPLLAIAEVAGGTWPERARKAAQALATAVSSHGEQDFGVLLLAHIRELFESEPGADFLPTERILLALNARDDGPWAESGPHGGLLTANRLGKRLGGFGIKSGGRQSASGPRGYFRQAFEDAWRRYLTPEEVA